MRGTDAAGWTFTVLVGLAIAVPVLAVLGCLLAAVVAAFTQ